MRLPRRVGRLGGRAAHPHLGALLAGQRAVQRDLLARALRENVAFVPGAGAYLDGRGHSSMRLNFSASTDDEIREGIRRIGEVVNEQVALYGTLTGEERSKVRVRRTPSQAADPPRQARVVPLRRRAQGGR